ncbi:protein TPR3 isoform X2 [Canna indica]|uniref:Protein TPR3 isoform X2 n=1 Tax=Canna indica TaxID=4628 RepID=A0AAQ3KR68_9LILI|nr:protein TPR3 isoform X2 [Canna indica]
MLFLVLSPKHSDNATKRKATSLYKPVRLSQDTNALIYNLIALWFLPLLNRDWRQVSLSLSITLFAVGFPRWRNPRAIRLHPPRQMPTTTNTPIGRDLIFLILQFLDEEKYKETVHKLEEESAIYFNTRYFEELILEGKMEEGEKYLSGFTKMDDNRYTMKIVFEIRKQKYLEALDMGDKAKAIDILQKELKVFSRYNADLFKEMAALLTMDNFRENAQLSLYRDTMSARQMLVTELKKLISLNPLLRDKLQFPKIRSLRLRHLINQSLNWQHSLCNNSRISPDIKSLFVDHSCHQSNSSQLPSHGPIMKSTPKTGSFLPLGTHGQAVAPLPASLAGWMNNAYSFPPHPPNSATTLGPSAALLKYPLTSATGNPAFFYHSADPEHVAKRPRSMGLSQEIGLLGAHLHTGYPSVATNHSSLDELPKIVVTTLNQGSSVVSMDFHPVVQTILLVGTKIGDISIWELASKKRIAHREFKVWDHQECSTSLQAALTMETAISVNRVTWNADGKQCAVAYSKHLVHLFTFNSRDELLNHLQIEAHHGGVNDVAFSQPNEKKFVITCGDDKTVKVVWDAISGVIQYTFEGHETSVCSVLPHIKETFPLIFSTSSGGTIKAWFYENGGPKLSYTAPNNWCHAAMVYSADGKRLFSCGTAKDGTSSLVEWNDADGTINRTYEGLSIQSIGVIQFDLIKNKFIAVGDEFMVKFWDMNNPKMLTSTDAEGGLEALPRVRINKNGSLLASSANNNGIKILANADGKLLLFPENLFYIVTRRAFDSISKNGDGENFDERRIPRLTDESLEKSNIWKLTEISEPSQLCYLQLPDNSVTAKVSRLTYSKSGYGVLALAFNGVHKLWKWFATDLNDTRSRKAPALATTSMTPVLWQPSNCSMPMTNEISGLDTDKTVHCFALSKNDSYVVSASGKKISLFNMMTFKIMATFMVTPPVATYVAFHPLDNNIIAIGMDDSTIQIYNVQLDEVKFKLRQHHKRITGLAFSLVLEILISSGADCQLCAWVLDGWEMKDSKLLQLPEEEAFNLHRETKVQFHFDQTQLLVANERQLSIYDAAKLECLKQWILQDGLITDATYSCNSQMIYTTLMDGSVNIFTETLILKCRIKPTAYLNAQPSLSGYPLVVAAHPSLCNQFAMGLSDGHVIILEPLESEWGTTPVEEDIGNLSLASRPTNN